MSYQPPMQSYPQAGQPYPPKPLKRTGPLVTLISGVVALVIGGICVVVPLANGLDSLDVATFETNTSMTRDLEADSTYMLAGETNDDLSCEVVSPSGSSLELTEQNSANSSNSDIYQFTTEEAGTYTIECDGQAGNEVVFTNLSEASGLVGVSIAIIVGMSMLFIGFVLALVGLIWLINRNGKIKRQRAQFPDMA